MKNFKYFLQFFCILFLFGVFKIVGIKFSRIISENIMVVFGPIFRSKKIIIKNLSIAFPNFRILVPIKALPWKMKRNKF